MTGTATRSLGQFLRRNVPALLLAGGLTVLTYRIVLNFQSGKSDFIDHLEWAQALNGPAILAAFRGAQERLWHICVYLLLRLGMDDVWKAGALVTAGADAAAYFLVYKCWDRSAPEKQSRCLLAGLLACAFLASSLTWSGQSFYTGRAAVNTWHNPTNIMARPFAAAVFYMTVCIYNRRRYGHGVVLPPPEDAGKRFSFAGSVGAELRRPVFKGWELALYPVCVLLSAYAKPSFLQFFVPAVFLFLLWDVLCSKGWLLPFSCKMALPYLPAALILLLQVFHFFGGSVSVGGAGASQSASGIAIYYIQPAFSGEKELLRVTLEHCKLFLFPCAFPLLMLLAAPRRSLRSAALRLGWLCLIAGFLEMTFLHETGERASHGNFSWGYYLAIWLLWTASVRLYADLLRGRGASSVIAWFLGTPLLAWHVVCGVMYIEQIFRTAEFYF